MRNWYVLNYWIQKRFAFDSIFNVNRDIVADNEQSRADDDHLQAVFHFYCLFQSNLHTGLLCKRARWCLFLFLFTLLFTSQVLILNLHLSFIALRNFNDHSPLLKMICAVLMVWFVSEVHVHMYNSLEIFSISIH